MTRLDESAKLSDLHLLVLGGIAYDPSADALDLATWLGVSVAIVEALCADSAASGAHPSCGRATKARRQRRQAVGRHRGHGDAPWHPSGPWYSDCGCTPGIS